MNSSDVTETTGVGCPDPLALVLFARGEIEGPAIDKTETHLKGCALCRLEVDSIRELEEIGAALAPEAIPEGMPDSLWAKIRSVVKPTVGMKVWIAAARAANGVAEAGSRIVGLVNGKLIPEATLRPLAPEPVRGAAATEAPSRAATALAGGIEMTVLVATGRVRVQVQRSGSPVEGVTVSLECDEPDSALRSTTDGEGICIFRGLNEGEYKVFVS